jgi:hypothetical protein
MNEFTIGVGTSGSVLVSVDGGSSWPVLDREFGETRAVAVTPALA